MWNTHHEHFLATSAGTGLRIAITVSSSQHTLRHTDTYGPFNIHGLQMIDHKYLTGAPAICWHSQGKKNWYFKTWQNSFINQWHSHVYIHRVFLFVNIWTGVCRFSSDFVFSSCVLEYLLWFGVYYMYYAQWESQTLHNVQHAFW